MNRSNIGAVRLSFLTAAVLAILAVPASAQVVERGRTWDDLVASHPCASGLTGRIARVTDCDAADDVGDGGGAFQCWVSCDGSAPWVTQAIGAGGGGLPGADEVTESMLKVVNACTDEYVLTCETTTGDFEWQAAATGDVVGPASATDNCIATFNSTTGKLIQCNSSATLGDTGRLILDSSATAYATPTFAWSGDPDTGFTYEAVTGATAVVGDGAKILFFSPAGLTAAGKIITSASLNATTQYNGGGTAFVSGVTQYLSTGAALGASPNTVQQGWSNLLITNEGDTAQRVLNLPTAVAGAQYFACVQDVDGIRLVANTSDTIRVIDKVTAAAGYIESATIGSCVGLKAINAVEWFATSVKGIWTDGTFTYDDTSLTTP